MISMVPAPTFGVLLRRARRAAGLTQEELAGRAGISVDAISVLERGLTRIPHQETLDLLAAALVLEPAERAQWEIARRGPRMSGAAPAASDSHAAGPSAGSLEGYHSAGSVPEPLACRRPGMGRPLPTPATPLIGREQEVGALRALLQRPAVRLLTVTGSAGVGKTRLALMVAAELATEFAAGAVFVPLATLTDPALVLPAIAEALGLPEAGTHPVLTRLATGLHAQPILIVLDNFEQVLAAAPELAALLEACPTVKLLVTSREVLHLRAEHQFVAPPLALPELPPRAALPPLDTAALAANPAVQLFLQRAQAAQPDFQLTPGNAATIAAICRRLEGLPLALELAAPRLKVLAPPVLLARLEERLQVLTGGARDLPERQRTMRATVAWSYELLAPAEQALFRRLAVFAGGWTLAAAEQVWRGAGPMELGLLEGVSVLLDKSLLHQESGSNGEARFSMLAVLREFGLEQLDAAGEGTTAREAHATYYLTLAEAASPQAPGAGPSGRLEGLEREHDNLRAALNWWLEQAEQPSAPAAERALRLWWALSPFWLESCYRAGYATVQRVLALQTGVAAPVQVKALLYAAAVLRSMDEGARAAALGQEALVLARRTCDLPGIAYALQTVGEVAVQQDQYPAACAAFAEAAALAQQRGAAAAQGRALQHLVDVLIIQGEYAQALGRAEEGLAIFQAQGAARQMCESLARLGWALLLAQGDSARATSLAEQGLALVRAGGPRESPGGVRFLLGELLRHQGRLAEARTLLEESLGSGTGPGEPRDLFQRQTRLARLLAQQGDTAGARALYEQNRTLLPLAGYKYLIADYLEGRGMLEAALGAPGRAAQLWGAAAALREGIGAPMYPVDRDIYAQAVAAARAQLGATAFAAAWAAGRALPPEVALATVD